ncbi:Fluconazole resistance protein 3 [Wickerhamomyces ciferrii]|uniref:Fluconazole resistance protein 3 n=1 Tax=Wickerhamomyces ciferrii (strain ATCC 14091 / BCRC 22168 / CBS 111 / JCM 3599 / NBRC 0793 / NRRL Y-1031 F-60-10) TaxID=1206466 RepID=K0KS31_WICCF|nr:Fluconazole resistance protein 3 [Wickerhamomyces ciferrii]CCH44777.1 Fluconazole resistance protein 3 [Wickerhamomyces ciferrii]
MNQTYNYGYQQDEPWLSTPQFNESVAQFNQGYNDNIPKNLDDGFLTDNFTNQPQQFNEFVSNNSNNQNNQQIQQQQLNINDSIYNSSDKSSPSSILNNNNQNQIPSADIDESNLSEKEIANRRKAQNRAAQRAFRERKELKLKELEEKLSKSENDKTNLLQQLQDLKKQNVIISTENKLLLQNGNSLIPLNNQDILSNFSNQFSFPSSSDRIKSEPESPIKLDYSGINLTITQVWEYLNELNDKYDKDYDLNVIMNKIKGLEVCHERGAAYPKSTIDSILVKYDNGEI